MFKNPSVEDYYEAILHDSRVLSWMGSRLLGVHLSSSVRCAAPLPQTPAPGDNTEGCGRYGLQLLGEELEH